MKFSTWMLLLIVAFAVGSISLLHRQKASISHGTPSKPAKVEGKIQRGFALARNSNVKYDTELDGTFSLTSHGIFPNEDIDNCVLIGEGGRIETKTLTRFTVINFGDKRFDQSFVMQESKIPFRDAHRQQYFNIMCERSL